MSALPIDHAEPRLARLLTKVTGWQHMHTDVVTILGRQGEKVLVQQINKPYRTALVQEDAISFSCECDDGGPATHLVLASVAGTHVEYLVCDQCFASEQYIHHRIEWQHINQPRQEEPVMPPIPTIEIEEQQEQSQKPLRRHAATGSALVEQAEAMWALMEKHGWSARRAGQQLGIAQIKSSEFSRLMRAPEDLREAVRAGKMSLYAALAEAKARPQRRPIKVQPAPAQEEQPEVEVPAEVEAEEERCEWSGLPWRAAAKRWRAKASAARAAESYFQERALAWCSKARVLEEETKALRAKIETWEDSDRALTYSINAWAARYEELEKQAQRAEAVVETLQEQARHHRETLSGIIAERDAAIEERDQLQVYLQEALASRQQVINIYGGQVTIAKEQA